MSESTALDSARKLGAQSPAPLETAHARVDETIRVALGFQKTLVPGEWIATDFSIHPLRIQSRAVLGSWVARFFGRRHLLLRVAKPEPADVEKNICRIRDHDLITMGTKSGNRVVLQSVQENGERFELTRLSIQALALTSEIIKERHDLESDQQSLGWNADYVNARTLVSQRNHDLAYTMIDFQNREVLGLEPGFPVLARRDISSAFFNEFLEFGVVVLTSFLALQVVLNPIWRSLNVGAMGRGLLDLTMSLLSSTLLITLRLRSDIR